MDFVYIWNALSHPFCIESGPTKLYWYASNGEGEGGTNAKMYSEYTVYTAEESSIENRFLSFLLAHCRTTPDPEDPNSGQEPVKEILLLSSPSPKSKSPNPSQRTWGDTKIPWATHPTPPHNF